MVAKQLRRLFDNYRRSHDRREVVVAAIVWGSIILYIPLSRLFDYWRGNTAGSINWDGLSAEFLALIPFAILFAFNDLVLSRIIFKLRKVVLYVVLAVASALFMSLAVEVFRSSGVPDLPPDSDARPMMRNEPPPDGRGGPATADSLRSADPRFQSQGPPPLPPDAARDGNFVPPKPPEGDMGRGPFGGEPRPGGDGDFRPGPGGGADFRPDEGFDRGLRPGAAGGFRPGPMMTDFLLALMMLCASTLVKVYLLADRDKDRLRQLAKERAEAELAQLRYQISPHFMMNTLNNIHALVDIDADRAKDTIVRLSRLMRYMLHDGSQPLVPLAGEVAFLTDYVELMRIRYTDAVSIRLSMPQDTDGISIPPLLFVNIVENAFKHGVSYAKDSFVDISLSISDDRRELNFCCVNSLAPARPEEPRHGIGLANTRKRLELLCQGRHQISALKLSDRYVVSIQITTP